MDMGTHVYMHVTQREKNKTENNKYHAVLHKICEIDNTETQSSLAVTLSYSIIPYGMCKAKPWEAKRLARVPWLQASKGCFTWLQAHSVHLLVVISQWQPQQ